MGIPHVASPVISPSYTVLLFKLPCHRIVYQSDKMALMTSWMCVLLLCVGAVTSSTKHMTSPPEFCHKLNCPKYTVLNSTETWELRHYEATVYSATNSTSDSRDLLFDKLFGYISGHNVNATKIAMTTPVLTTEMYGGCAHCPNLYIMHFMLPFDLQDKPPHPSAEDVYIVNMPPLDVYVRSLSGYAKEEDFEEALHQLQTDIQKSGGDIEGDHYFQAVYDGPYTFRHRHNEVWLQKPRQ